MDNILVACVSRVTAERGLRVAADLSVASGATLSLAVAPADPPRTVAVSSGLNAVGYLSCMLFTPRGSNLPVPAFRIRETNTWIASMSDQFERCCEPESVEALVEGVRLHRPDLIVACDGWLADTLVTCTETPVWRVRPKQCERSWFSARKIKCAVRGSRALEWAGRFAEGLGAELETMRTGLFGGDRADLVVVNRGRRAPLFSALTDQPIVVV